ncbi:uncharacterized protein SAPINGB_P006373 [Magnusiomyces paraingens]|uniref:Transport protein particle subunit trs85-2 n=1 Tax=Magnusiomyces paraingens TaxID=2606893 RepID=A0A5E8CBN9_9ASCO|nr:uncharacterized protein SAPINGB_P006373 [Saprochaete ingens]VVT58766.1 unnamed protein product [Saprochaete ingens]
MSRENPQLSSLQCQSLVTRALAPHIAVYASKDTENLAIELGFKSFHDLLRPFGDKIPGRVTVRDSQGLSNSFEDFSVHFVTPPSTKKQSAAPASTSHLSPGFLPSHNRGRSIDTLFNRNINPAMCIYDRDTLECDIAKDIGDVQNHSQVFMDFFQKILTNTPVTPFETFSHPVAGVIAISSRNETPIETLSFLYNQSNDLLPEYINRDYLRYYVLVHDEQTDLAKSTALFEKMKRNFGLHCHMVRIKRAISEDTALVKIPQTEWQTYAEKFSQEDPISLHEADVSSLKQMVRELVVQSVIPFMERCSATWNDQIASSRRGLTGRFFSASRKYFSKGSLFSSSAQANAQSGSYSLPFSSGTPVAPSAAGGYNSTKGSYAYNSPEALLRKLADFAFMLRDYTLANSTYELLKSDFHNAKAWSHLAASQEMSAVSYLLSKEGHNLTIKARIDNIETLLDSATYSYISRCSLPSYALRCILLASELMCTTSSPSAASEGATRWLLKAINEDLTGPLGKAILLERISNAFSVYNEIIYQASADAPTVESPEILAARSRKSTRRRKAAFWMLLAARQWAAAPQDPATVSHARDAKACIEAAESVYADLEWAHRPESMLGMLITTLETKA